MNVSRILKFKLYSRWKVGMGSELAVVIETAVVVVCDVVFVEVTSVHWQSNQSSLLNWAYKLIKTLGPSTE